MLFSQQAKKFRIRNSLVLKPKTENSPGQNKLSSCFREENSCKSIFHSHSQFQFSNLHNSQLSLFLHSSPLRDLVSFEKKNKASTIFSAVPESRCLKHDRTLIDSVNTYYMPRTVQSIGNVNISTQRALCSWVFLVFITIPQFTHTSPTCAFS